MTAETSASGTLLKKPLMLYDGDCGFCATWIARWKAQTGHSVDYLTAQEYLAAPEALRPVNISAEDLSRAVHLIDPDLTVTSGAEAVFKCLKDVPGKSHWFKRYQKNRTFAHLSEWGYRRVANSRQALSWFNQKILKKEGPACTLGPR